MHGFGHDDPQGIVTVNRSRERCHHLRRKAISLIAPAAHAFVPIVSKLPNLSGIETATEPAANLRFIVTIEAKTGEVVRDAVLVVAVDVMNLYALATLSADAAGAVRGEEDDGGINRLS